MAATVVVDLDRVLLSGDAATLFLRGALAGSPGRAGPLLPAAPLLLAGSALPWTRPLAARALTRLALGRRPRVGDVAAAYRRAVVARPESVVAEAVACVRRHQAAGDVVVVATGCEQRLAEGFLAAAGLGDLEVVGSATAGRPPFVRRAMGPEKVAMLRERGHPPPWRAVYSDSDSDLPLFRGAERPVLVNASPRAAARVRAALGRPVDVLTWR
ncbi:MULTISPECIES: HAD family hydrolase [unclassified Blastococcus]